MASTVGPEVSNTFFPANVCGVSATVCTYTSGSTHVGVVPYTDLIVTVGRNSGQLECYVIATANRNLITVECAECSVTISYKESGLVGNPLKVGAESLLVCKYHTVQIVITTVTGVATQTSTAAAVDEVR